MYLRRQAFLVLGLSKSGCAATEFLLKKRAIVYVYDDLENERMEKVITGLEAKGAKRVPKEYISRMVGICDGVVLSPGIPVDHPIAVAFKRQGKAVLGEAELAARYMHCHTIAVTGTNGKTTVVSMLTDLLKKGGLEASACGNIGVPMLELYDAGEEMIAVTEISSFQLETLHSLRPHIAMILNVSEDHLNRHYNMENYVFLKEKLLKNCTETEYAILNYDDEKVRAFAKNTRAQVLYFSIKERVKGAFYEGGDLYFGKERIISAAHLPVGGLHNVQNALAVIIAAKILGIKNEDIASALLEFKGIHHRMEWVAEVDGVTYIDDSKGTNVDATLKAIEGMDKETILLLGGKNKGYEYGKLFEGIGKTRVVHAVFYGENRFSLLQSARENGFEQFTLCNGFSFAVRVAILKASAGQCVLLSPASASFDEFASYEERGEKFVEIIRELERKEENEGGEAKRCAQKKTEEEGGQCLLDEKETLQ